MARKFHKKLAVLKTLKLTKMEKVDFANSADPDEVAHYDHLIWFFTVGLVFFFNSHYDIACIEHFMKFGRRKFCCLLFCLFQG